LLLNDKNPTNQLYAIEKLDSMSLAGRAREDWSRSPDFKRARVLQALLPLTTNANANVAGQSIVCFGTQSNAAVLLRPFSAILARIANEAPVASDRIAAISALSGLQCESVSNSLAQLLNNEDTNVRVKAVQLLPRFPADFAEALLGHAARDASPEVRSLVADVIGDNKLVRLLPILTELFRDPVGKDPLIKPLTMDQLKAGSRWSNIGDVHTSAGLALVKLDVDQVEPILRTNLDDPGFHINFVSKLAEKDAGSWLPELSNILKARREYVDEVSQYPARDPRRLADPASNTVLTGTYAQCWENIRAYLMKLPPQEFSTEKVNRHINELEEAVRPVHGCPGCGVEQARALYELYRTKGLQERADHIRSKFAKSDRGWFDDYDEQHQAH
jgi:hypothetical protein